MLKIINGEVYDPANGINGQLKELYVEGGKMVEQLSDPGQAQVIDAQGMVIMPGGIDIHSHIAGPKVNTGRSIRPEDHRGTEYEAKVFSRSGVGSTIPSTFTTGYLYSKLGYTTVMEAAVPPLKARHAHEELADIPLVDKGFYTLMGNNHFVFKYIQEENREALKNYVAWLLCATKGYGIKVVNPGGVENFKQRKDLRELDENIEGYGITPRQVIKALVKVNEELGLPHPLHIHCNNIGHPGGYLTTLDTMKTVGDQRLHLTHIQFHSYAKTKSGSIRSGALEVADYVNQHPNITVDVGQMVFGEATTMTADSPLEYKLHTLLHNKWVNNDVELETGSGIVPLTYREKNLTHGVQWAIGLEMFLAIKNPWQVYLSTDHPNAGPFTAYPGIIKLLMDRHYREELLNSLHPKVKKRTSLANMTREYTLEEIAIITRSGPAKTLGLMNKGHLGQFADADLVLYRKQEDVQLMFQQPAFVIKDGVVVVKDQEIMAEHFGRTFYVRPLYDESVLEGIRKEFDLYSTVSFDNYAVEKEYLKKCEVIPCK